MPRRRHKDELPHVVRFSGGRSSAMMTLMLLDEQRLDPARGDVVLFNNTGAEAPATYAFVRTIREQVERAGIPFLSAEFATAEVHHHARWTRTPTYRLVNERPHSEANPQGFDWRGTPFEELISWSGYTPSYYNRTCTAQLKIESTTRVLCDWLSEAEGPGAIGHSGEHSRIDPDTAWQVHRSAGGQRSREAFLRTRRFAWARAPQRAAQRFAAFSPSAEHHACTLGRRTNAAAGRSPHGTRAYVSLMGLRADEQRRIEVIRHRARTTTGPLDEYPKAPLDDAAITRDDVRAFWEGRADDLQAPHDIAMSNCVYCFLKGTKALRALRAHIETHEELHAELAIGGAGTPCDWRWWAALEARYARDLDPGADAGNTLPACAERSGSVCYDAVLTSPAERIANVYTIDMVPCDCTD